MDANESNSDMVINNSNGSIVDEIIAKRPTTINELVKSICLIVEGHGSSQVLVTLIKLLRCRLCPQTIGILGVHTWDSRCADILVSLLLPATPRPCWERQIKDLIDEEFNHCEPYDGQLGIIKYLEDQVLSLVKLVSTFGQERELINFCKDGGLFDESLRHVRWRKFFSRTTFIHYKSIVPEGWTLLHHASWLGSPNLIATCLRLGISMDSTDWQQRTPLHIAAASAKEDAIKCLLNAGASTKVLDKAGFHPLGLMLHSLSRTNWRQKLSAKSLINCISMFLTTNNFALWEPAKYQAASSDAKEIEGDSKALSSTTTDLSISSMQDDNYQSSYEDYSLSLACTIGSDDAFLANSILSIAAARRYPNQNDRSLHLVRYILLYTIRRNKLPLLVAILDHFHFLICPSQMPSIGQSSDNRSVIPIAALRFIRYAITSALITRNEKIIYQLFERISPFFGQFFTSIHDHSVEAEEVNGIDMALVCSNHILLHCVLRGQRELVDRLLQTPFRASDESIIMPLSLFLRFEEAPEESIENLAELLVKDIDPNSLLRSNFPLMTSSYIEQSLLRLSPLALACLLGDQDSVRLLLRSLSERLTSASYCRANMYLVGESDESTSNGESDEANFIINYPQHPIFCCAITANHQCLRAIMDHMGENEFVKACNYRPGGVDALEALLSILNFQLWSNTVGNRDYIRNSKKNSFPLFAHEADILSSLYLHREDVLETVRILVNAKEKLIKIEGSDVNTLPALDSSISDHWSRWMTTIEMEWRRLNDRLHVLLPGGDLLATDISLDSAKSRAPTTMEYESPTRKQQIGSPTKSPLPAKATSSVSQLVSHFSHLIEQAEDHTSPPSSARKSSSKKTTPSRMISVAGSLLDNSRDTPQSTGNGSGPDNQVLVSYVGSSNFTEDHITRLNVETVSILTGVRDVMAKSEASWNHLIALIDDKNTFANNFRLLAKQSALDPNCWNKLAQIIMTMWNLPSQQSNQPIQSKPTEWWNKFVKQLNSHTRSTVSKELGDDNYSSPRRKHQIHTQSTGIESLSELLLSYSSPFGKNYAPNSDMHSIKIISKSMHSELIKLFAEVKLSMGKDNYFDHLRSTKLKAGVFIHNRVLSALKLMYDWITAILDDANLFHDGEYQTKLFKFATSSENDGLWENIDKSRLMSHSIEIVNALDRQSYLQAFYKQCRVFNTSSNYSRNSYLSTLLAPVTWRYDHQMENFSQICSKGGLTFPIAAKLPLMTERNSLGASQISKSMLLVSFTLLQCSTIVKECVNSGSMSESAKISQYLGICPFTSTSQVHFHRLMFRAQTAQEKPDLIETVACLLIKKRNSINLDVSRFDLYGRTALLNSCAAQYWRAARMLVECTLVDPVNECVSLASFAVLPLERRKSIVKYYLQAMSPFKNIAKIDHIIRKRNVGSVMVLNPLHFAIEYNAVEFILFFLTACPNIPVDLSLFQLSIQLGSSTKAGLCLLAKTNAFQIDGTTTLGFSVGSAFGVYSKPFNLRLESGFASKEQRAVQAALSILSALEQAASQARMNSVAILRAPTDSIAKSLSDTQSFVVRTVSPGSGEAFCRITPQFQGSLQGLCVVDHDFLPSQHLAISSKSQQNQLEHRSTSILLLDGTCADYQSFINDPSFFLRAMPAPLQAAGMIRSNTSILHQLLLSSALSTSKPIDFYKDLLDTLTDYGASRMFSVNIDGHTPVFNGLVAGKFNDILFLLARAGEVLQVGGNNFNGGASESARSALNSLNSLDPRFYRGLLCSQSALAVYPYTFRILVEQANNRLMNLEYQLRETRNELDCVPPSQACVALLIQLQSRAEQVWKFISKSDFTSLLTAAYAPPGCVLDSIIRAKQVLGLLGIPFSQLGNSNSIAGPNGEKLFELKLKYLENISPSSIKRNLPLGTCNQLKDLLITWYRQQSDFEASAVEATQFVFHRHDVSILDLGEGSLEVLDRNMNRAHKSHKILRSVGNSLFSDVSRGYLYLNSCNDHIGDIGINFGRKFVSKRILSASSLKSSRMKDSVGRTDQLVEKTLNKQFIALYSKLPRQLQVETRAAYNNLVASTDTDKLSSPRSPLRKSLIHENKTLIEETENLDENPQLSAFMTKQMTEFFDYWSQQSDRVVQALRLSYYILDLARLVVNCRLLTIMTTYDNYSSDIQTYNQSSDANRALRWNSIMSPSRSITQSTSFEGHEPNRLNSIIVLHPLESLLAKRSHAEQEFKRVCSLFGHNDLPTGMTDQRRAAIDEYGHGLYNRIKIMDELSVEDIVTFFRGTREICGPSLTALREIVLEGLATLLLAFGKPKLCDFVCKLARKNSSRYDRNAQYADQQGISLFYGEDLLNLDIGEKSEFDVSPSESEKRSIVDLIVFLQQLRIIDVVDTSLRSCQPAQTHLNGQTKSDYFASLRQTCSALRTMLSDLMTTSMTRYSYSASGKASQISTSAELTEMLVECRTSDLETHFQFERSRNFESGSPIKSPNSRRIDSESLLKIRADLRRIMTATTSLASFIFSISGLNDHAPLFAADLQLNLPLIEDSNELAALCIPKKFHLVNGKQRGTVNEDLLTLSREAAKDSTSLRRHFNLHSNDSKLQNDIDARIQCCKVLPNFGIPVVPLRIQDDRSPLCLAAVMGYDQLLTTILSLEALQEIPFQLPCFRYLIWHTLMECSPPHALPKHCIIQRDQSIQLDTHHRSPFHAERQGFLNVLQLLVDRGFPLESPQGSSYSCADLAALKKIPSVFSVAIKRCSNQPEESVGDSTAITQSIAPNYFVAMHYALFWSEVESSSFRDIAIVSTARSRRKLFGQAPAHIISPRLDSDVSVHIEFMRQQMSQSGFFEPSTESLNNSSPISSTDGNEAGTRKQIALRNYFSSRIRYTVAASLLANMPLIRRIETCPLWKSFRAAISDLCAPLARVARLQKTSNQTLHANPQVSKSGSTPVYFPGNWTNFHLALAARNSRWFVFLVTAVASSAGIGIQRTNLKPSSRIGTQEDIENISHFRESVSSIILTACYYDDAVALARIITFVQEDKQASKFIDTNTMDPLSAGLLSATGSNGIAGDDSEKPLGLTLLTESDHFEPLGRQLCPLDVCMMQSTASTLLLLVKQGVFLSWNNVVTAIISGKFDRETAMVILRSYLVTMINSHSGLDISESSLKTSLMEALDDGFDPTRVPHAVVSTVNQVAKSYDKGLQSSGKHSKEKRAKEFGVLSPGDTLLCYCCRHGMMSSVLLLLQAGADVSLLSNSNQKGVSQLSPLECSMGAGQQEVTRAISGWVRMRIRRVNAILESIARSEGEGGIADVEESSLINAGLEHKRARAERESDQLASVKRLFEAVRIIEFQIRKYLLRRHRQKRRQVSEPVDDVEDE